MKKILSLLASIGLVASTSGAIVSCAAKNESTEIRTNKPPHEIIEAKITEQDKKIAELNLKIKEAKENYETATETNEAIKEKISSFNYNIHVIERQESEVNKSISITNNKVINVENEINSKNKDIDNILGNEKVWINDHSKEFYKEISRLKESIKVIENQNHKYDAEANHSKLKLVLKEKELGRIKNNLVVKENEKVSVSEELKELWNKKKAIGKNSSELEKDMIDSINSRFSELMDKNFELSMEIRELEKTKDKAINEWNTLYASLNELLEKQRKYKEENNFELGGLNAEIKHNQIAIEKLKQNTPYTDSIKSLNDDKELLNRQLIFLNNSLLELSEKVSQLEMNAEQINSDINEWNNHLFISNKDLEGKEKILNKLNEELTTAKAIKEDLRLQKLYK